MGRRRKRQQPKDEDTTDKVIVKLEPAAVESYGQENDTIEASTVEGTLLSMSDQEHNHLPLIEGMEVQVHVIQPVDSLSDSGEEIHAPTPAVCSGKEQIIVENYEHPYYKHSTRSRSGKKPSVTSRKQVTQSRQSKTHTGKPQVEKSNELSQSKTRKKKKKSKAAQMKSLTYQNYRCPYCFDISKRATFVIGSMEKRVLEKHIKTVHNVKTLKGCVACDAVFRNIHDLNIHHYKAHKLVSDDVQEYKCAECGYKTLYPNNFKRHLLNHEQKSISCTICWMDFATEEQVNNHMENAHRKKKNNKLPSSGYHKHTAYTGFKCELCQETLESLVSLEEHIDTAHLVSSV